MIRLFQRNRKRRKEDDLQDLNINQQAKKLQSHTAVILEEERDLRFEDDEYPSVGKLLEEMEENKQEKSKRGNDTKEKSNKPLIPKIEHNKINYKNKEACIEYVKQQNEIIAITKQQLVETKVEYGAVTSYLTDIQKIDRMQQEEREKLTDSARRVVGLTKERLRFQNREVKISEAAYKHLERYEDTIPKEIKKLQECEQYEQLVKKDLETLEGEKAVLTYEKDSLDQRKSYLQCIAIIAVLLLLILFFMFFVFKARFEIDVTTPVLITVIVGIVSAFFLFVENNKMVQSIKLNERKLNKQIGLSNKVKIKFVNNRNNLDYLYQKLRVNDSKELEYLWKEYVKAKEEMRRYYKNTELLELYREAMLEQLDANGVEDSEIWLHQPQALVDEKEMVEVRHRLNNRRQRLREQIDYNNQLVEGSKKEIEKILDIWPEIEQE